jgi:phosphoribosylglycinamide formyltransferase 1
VFPDDTIETLARRHYENEINILGNILDHLNLRAQIGNNITKPPRKRMKKADEIQVLKNFKIWKKKFKNKIYNL